MTLNPLNSGRCGAAWTALVLLLGSAKLWAAPKPESPRVKVEPVSRGFTVRAVDAPLAEILLSLARATDCRIEFTPKVGARKLTVNLGGRPADSIVYALARRAEARVAIVHRFRLLHAGEKRRKGPEAFASQTVTLQTQTRRPLRELWPLLNARVEVEQGIEGEARVFAVGHTLRRALDQIADQVGAAWTTVARFDERSGSDAAADGGEDYERMLAHFSDLARLESEERREELESDIETLLDLPVDRRERAARIMAADVLSLSTVYERIPGERRHAIGSKVGAIIDAYDRALRGISEERRPLVRPVIEAVEQVRRSLAETR